MRSCIAHNPLTAKPISLVSSDLLERPKKFLLHPGCGVPHALEQAHTLPMPAVLFWLFVIAVLVLFQLTTRAQRRRIAEKYWPLFALLGVIGLASEWG